MTEQTPSPRRRATERRPSEGAVAGAEPVEHEPIARILVAIDASRPSLVALVAAARLAATLRADLEGLFIEDTDLLSFAELPFASVTGAWLGGQRRVQQGELERSVRRQAQRAREAVSREANAAGVRWSFRVVRGNVQRVLLDAAQQADLLSLGHVGVSASRRRGGGSLAHRAARSAPRSVMIVREPAALSHAPVVVLLGVDPERAMRVLRTAALVARAGARPLVVVLQARPANREAFFARAQALLAETELEAARWIEPLRPSRPGCAGLSEALRAAKGGLLVLHAVDPELLPEEMEELLDRGTCSLLLLR